MKKTTNKMMKKAMSLKGFLGSMGKKKGEMGMGMTPPSNKITSSQSKNLGVAKGTPYKTTATPSDKINTVRSSYSTPPKSSAELNAYMLNKNKPSMKKGGESEFPDLTGDGKVTRADVLKGRGVFKKGGMSRMANEGFKNAKRTITDGYRGTGAPNPLAAIVKNTVKKSKMGMKPKMQMGGNTGKIPKNYTTERYSADMINRMPSKNTPTDSATLNKSLNLLNSLTDGIGKKETMKKGKMKPKMGMGGMPPNAFGLGVQPLSLTKKDGMDQYYKKGGMIKKKKK